MVGTERPIVLATRFEAIPSVIRLVIALGVMILAVMAASVMLAG